MEINRQFQSDFRSWRFYHVTINSRSVDLVLKDFFDNWHFLGKSRRRVIFVQKMLKIVFDRKIETQVDSEMRKNTEMVYGWPIEIIEANCD